MAIITDVTRNLVGVEIKGYYDDSLPLIVKLAQNKKNISEQLDAMRSNKVDYTNADCLEVQNILEDLSNRIDSI